MSQQQDDLIVKKGIIVGLLFSLAIAAVLYYFVVPAFESDLALPERIALGIKASILPSLALLSGIFVVGISRFGNESQDPTKVESATQRMRINSRYLGNTLEQFAAFFVNSLGLAVLLPEAQLQWVLIYSMLFVVGRVVFWLGYHINVLYRAPGFGLTFMPTVIAALVNTYMLAASLFSH